MFFYFIEAIQKRNVISILRLRMSDFNKKGPIPFGTDPHYTSISSNYCNLNTTGTVYFTRTFLPFCTPGLHFGIELITRIASLSKYASTPRTTSGFEIDPSLSTTNWTITLPAEPIS